MDVCKVRGSRIGLLVTVALYQERLQPTVAGTANVCICVSSAAAGWSRMGKAAGSKFVQVICRALSIPPLCVYFPCPTALQVRSQKQDGKVYAQIARKRETGKGRTGQQSDHEVSRMSTFLNRLPWSGVPVLFISKIHARIQMNEICLVAIGSWGPYPISVICCSSWSCLTPITERRLRR